MREVKAGEKYRHFKGDVMTIIAVATHTETKEKFVVYEHQGTIWARPYEMFTSEVDHKKYPDVKQKYRFEHVDKE